MHLGFKKEWGIALYKGIGKGRFTYSSMHKWRLHKVLAFYWPSQKICSSFMTNQCYVACCLQCVGWSCITCDYHRCWCLGLNSSHHPCRFLHTTDSSDVPMAIVHIRPHISSLVIVFRKRVFQQRCRRCLLHQVKRRLLNRRRINSLYGTCRCLLLRI